MLATQRYYLVGLAVFLILVTFTFFFRQEEALLYDKVVRVPYRFSKPTLRNTLLNLFDSIKHSPTESNYRSPSGKTYIANSTTTWRSPLGRKVLIVDIDTRVPTGENQILNPDILDFEHLDLHGGGLVSNAILNHYLYALIHGYDYKIYSAQHMPDHYDTWILPHVLRELIPSYQFVVAMDADVTISHMDVPLEWLFNRWGLAQHTSIAMPWDTEELHNNVSISRDSTGLRVLNTGFVVAQNNPTTMDMLEAWRDCTSETRYPGCAQWKKKWSHEQRAFSEYIRHDAQFNATPESIVSIPCDDAVGWPGFKKEVEGWSPGISDCNGNFVRHHTVRKFKVKTASSDAVMQVLTDVVQKNLLRDKEHMWVKEPRRLED